MGYFIYCSFLKQGEPVLEKRVPLEKIRTLSVGKRLKDKLKLDIEDSLVLGKAISKNQFSLKKISNLLLNDERNYAFISSVEKPLDNSLILSKGDFVCLKYKDIDILLKVKELTNQELEKEKKEEKDRTKLKFNFYFEHDRKNLKYLGISCLVTFIIMVSTLVAISRSKPITSISDIGSDKVLSLVHPDSFYLLPELVQDKLNRLSLIKNTLDTYIDYGKMFLNIENEGEGGGFVFLNSKKRYRDLYNKQALEIQSFEEKYSSSYVKAKPKYKVSIPVVFGQSIEKTCYYSIMKLWILHKSLEFNLERKKIFQNKKDKFFKNGSGYSYEEYPIAEVKSFNQSEEATESLGKITPFNLLTDEQQMYQDSKDLATRAQAYTKELDKRKQHSKVVQLSEIEIDPEIDYINYTNNIKNILLSDDKDASPLIQEFNLDKVKPVVHKGKLKSSIIEDIVFKHKYQIDMCYEKALRKNSVSGKVIFAWVITDKGNTEKVDVIDSSIKNKELINCMKQKILSWKYPSPKGGKVEVKYPFSFNEVL